MGFFSSLGEWFVKHSSPPGEEYPEDEDIFAEGIHGPRMGSSDRSTGNRDAFDAAEEYDRYPTSPDDDKKGEPGGSWGFR